MVTKRKSIVEENPLEKEIHRTHELPGDQLTHNGSRTSAEPKKLFAYKLPVSLGMKFKLYCHARGQTAEETLQELLTGFLKGKTIDPFTG
ncbi:MAG: hypothetical protein A2Z21_04955 [Candidatus Fraserbacteria bacterium RBG_16_55_9]|uniref:Uncharacterized protein n=1 Tax=Fraserbacteria sp. (strain RBG_16_55_9) TaxID=1817864 RepID=A0A1F5UPU8_FRAXR|nr:MAG: hypothetical protein A2Z21_04955 [Candidatus Fraserbacteria bacterium RBG_16_55_9]